MAKAESKIIIEFSEEDRALLRQLVQLRPRIITQPTPVPTYPQWWQNPVICGTGSTNQVQGDTDQIVINSVSNVSARGIG